MVDISEEQDPGGDRLPEAVDPKQDATEKPDLTDPEDERKPPGKVVHAKLDLIYVRGCVPFPAWNVEGTLVPCPTRFNLGFAVFENDKNRRREIPLETEGFQIFDTEWGLGRVRTTSGIGSAPSDAVTKLEVDPSTGRFSPQGKKHVQWDCPLAMTRVLDDNNNTVYSGWEVTLTDDGRTVMRSTTTLPSGQVYTEEEELVPLAQTDDEDHSVISVLSDPSSYGDGHSECAYAGYCLDDDHFSRECEDPDDTVVDVLNINRNLFTGGKVSEDGSSGFSNSKRSAEDGV